MAEYETTNGDQQYQETPALTEGYDQSGYEQQITESGGGDTADGQNPGDRINASKNDDDERKLFVGGLSWETTVKDLKEYFTKFGDVADCTLKTDPTTGRSRGFGFVLFADASSVEKVMGEKVHSLHNRNIDPKRAKARGGREPIKKVFIGGLDPEYPESELRDHFSKFGKIEEIDLPFDKAKNQRRAFCFITFESEEVVDKVCEAPKQKLGTKEVDVKKATPKTDNSRRGGFGFGGGFGGGRGRGGRGGYNNQGWGGQGYNQGYGGYNYNQNYGGGGYGGYGGYGGNNYDYSNYNNQYWGGSGYDQNNYGGGYGYGPDYNQGNYGYDYGGWGYGQDNSQGGQQNSGSSVGYKAKRGGATGASGYHPYSR